MVSLLKLALGTLQALALMVRQRPRALLLTGGWMGFPVALAAWLLRVPSVVYLPDLEPGLAIKALAPLVKRIALHRGVSQRFFPKRECAVVGYPLRASLRNARRAAGIERFGLTEEKRTLLVTGGSLGARRINQALLPILPALLDDGWQVLHITGAGNWQETQAALAETNYEHYQVFPYLDDMGLALAAADLALSRAGASALAEYPYFALPAILAPLSRSWRYQQVNANFLAQKGAAVILPDEQLPERILPTIRDLAADDGAKLKVMRERAAALAIGDGAEKLAAVLLECAG